MAKKFDIFISYRRKGGYDTAKLIFDRLRMDGYSVSFDMDTLVNGNFDSELEHRVNGCKDFLLILSPGVFDRFFDSDPDYDPENDWIRREISCALKMHKNIVPLFLDGFAYPKSLPGDVSGITKMNAIDLYPKYFEAAYDKMKSFLTSKPSFLVKHRKKIIAFASLAFLLLCALLFFAISELQDTQRAIALWQGLRNQPRTYHWNGSDDEIGRTVFEKIAASGIQRTECSGRGLLASLSKPNCRGEEEITCGYSPRLSFSTCEGRPVAYLEKNERFRSGTHKDSASALSELASLLRAADFGDWLAAMNSQNIGNQ